jgi:hypothetical protein
MKGQGELARTGWQTSNRKRTGKAAPLLQATRSEHAKKTSSNFDAPSPAQVKARPKLARHDAARCDAQSTSKLPQAKAQGQIRKWRTTHTSTQHVARNRPESKQVRHSFAHLKVNLHAQACVDRCESLKN